jgi:preprotein translocase subunit Sec63
MFMVSIVSFRIWKARKILALWMSRRWSRIGVTSRLLVLRSKVRGLIENKSIGLTENTVVVGEKLVTPLSFMNLIVKLRIPRVSTAEEEPSTSSKDTEKREQEFLVSKKDAEDVSLDNTGRAFAHAPHWPQLKKPSWWVILGDIKANRVVVPPFKVSDVPYTDSDYRMYKMQFQAPPNVGSYTWRIFVVSDTYVGDDTYQDITVGFFPVSSKSGRWFSLQFLAAS